MAVARNIGLYLPLYLMVMGNEPF